MNSFFSVVIPTLNEEKYIPRLLGDLSKQDFKDFEVVIVDGNSTDKTKDLAMLYEDKLNLKFYLSNRKNVAAQRNFGSEKSTGKYIIFLDADARIKHYFLKRVLKNINKRKGLLFIPFFCPDKGEDEYKPLFDLANVAVEFTNTFKKKFSLGGSIIAEKNFFELIGGFDENMYVSEDHELIQRASEWGVAARFIHDAKVAFSMRRIRQEGQLRLFYKYFVSTAHRLFIGEIKDKIYDYKMGGEVYAGDQKQKDFNINSYVSEIKKLFNKILS